MALDFAPFGRWTLRGKARSVPDLKRWALLEGNLKVKRFWKLLILSWVTLMISPTHADVIGGINFPRTLGGFELRSVIDNEKSNPGLGVTLLYNAPGVKVSVFVYDHSHSKVPEGIDSPIIHNEFSEARGNVQQAYPDAQILVREEQFLVAGVPFLQSAFQYTEMRQGFRESVLSHLYLTGKKGNFVKVRTTYSATDRPELGRRIQIQFIEALCEILAK